MSLCVVGRDSVAEAWGPDTAQKSREVVVERCLLTLSTLILMASLTLCVTLSAWSKLLTSHFLL